MPRFKKKRKPIQNKMREFVIREMHLRVTDHRHPGIIFMAELAPGVIIVNDASHKFLVYFSLNQWELQKETTQLGSPFHRKKILQARCTERYHPFRRLVLGAELSPHDGRKASIIDAIKYHLRPVYACVWHDTPQYF